MIDTATILRGRRSECEQLDRLIADARSGASGALVVRGDPGVGKTALLDYLLGQAGGCRVARAAGIESEMELAFAGLHQLCAPLADRIEHLPGPQRVALEMAFGLRTGVAADRFLVGLAVLSLLSDAADAQPLVCLVDDAQWLDRASAQVLGFVARRLGQEAVVLVFAQREPGQDPNFSGLPELTVGPLRDLDARAVLGAAIPARIDESVRDRIVAEARGNPLALLELPRGWTPAAFAGGFGLPDGVSVSERIQESFRRRLTPLPGPSRTLMLIAAAEPVGDATLIWAAAGRLRIPADSATPAWKAGLLVDEEQVRFRHPLVRSVVYGDATLGDRRIVHAALAEVTDPDSSPDRRAWHRAHAADGPTEAIALELVQSADRAQARGGLAAAAAFLGRAAELTPDPMLRTDRAIAAARAAHLAGATDAAERWLDVAETGKVEPIHGAQAARLRGQIAFTVSHGTEAPPLLLQAARDLEGLDADLARDTYLDALVAAQFAGILAAGSLQEIATAARAAPPSPAPRARDLLLDGFATSIIDGRAAGEPLLRKGLNRFRSEDPVTTGGFRWLWLAATAALELWDHESWILFTARRYELARDAGALGALPMAITFAIFVRAFGANLADVDALAERVHTVDEVAGSRHAPYASLLLAALRGREQELMALSETTLVEARIRGEGVAIPTVHWANAVLWNGLGRYQEALIAAQRSVEQSVALNVTSQWALPELIEAAVRCGRMEVAGQALGVLSDAAATSGTDWSRGLEARSRALTVDGDAAEPHYLDAIDRLGRTGLRHELARANLLYGEWLRRVGRRVDARDPLSTAHESFAAIGMTAFAERARLELIATGERVRKRTDDTRDLLTAQEAAIARLAREGHTNAEISARLYLSTRTVEWHLAKVFSKLGISSRKELGEALPADVVTAVRS